MSSKQFINVNNKYDRIVVLVDMDCFYCQVEEKLNPEIRGKPIAVVQYNPWKGGGIIAVNYLARAKGVTRHMRGDEAKQHCPNIVLPQVPQVRGKADISKYRDAGKEVATVLQTFTPLLERASVDEAYLDITELVLARLRDMNDGKFQLLPDTLANTFAVGYDSIGKFVQKISGELDDKVSFQAVENDEDRVAYKKSDIKLLIGASIVNEIRATVKEKTGYECSAGIAHNKILAKLTAGLHKPNKQTILPLKNISKLYDTLSIKKIKGLGGKLGDQVCEILKIQTMSELAKIPEKVLQNHFDERLGSWMYLMAKGIELEAVTPKLNSKSIGCCKRFPGKNAITGIATLQHWLRELANEIQERLEKDLDENNRTAKQITVSYAQQFGQNDISSTRSVPLASYDADRIANDAFDAIKRNTNMFLKPDSTGALNNPIKFLGISAGKFEGNVSGKKNDLLQMFSNVPYKFKEGEPSKDMKEAKLTLPTNQQENNEINKFFKLRNESKVQEKGITIDYNQHQTTVSDIHVINNANNSSIVSISEQNLKKDFIVESPLVSSSIMSIEKLIVEEIETKQIEDLSGSYFNATQPMETEGDVNPQQPSTSAAITLNSVKDEEATVTKDEKSSLLKVKLMESINEQVEIMKANELSSYNESHQADYHQTYVEFKRPFCVSELVQKACPECGKNVPEHNFQSHLDFHFALHLSQQQREEFRNEIKMKSMAGSTAATKLKTISSTQRSKTTTPLIDKFLTTVNITNTVTNGATKGCSECGKIIPTANMQEHLDYHAARKLQIELNKREMQVAKPSRSESDKGASTSDNNNNLKRKRNTPGDKNHSVKKSLSSYFTNI